MEVNNRNDDTGVVKGEFRSCTLIREHGSEIRHDTVLIPVKFAKLGKMLEVYENDEWRTVMVFRVSPSIVYNPVDPKVLIKSHRKATGDSMPKRGS